MKIQARPLKGEAFDVDVDPSETVEALKAKVATMRPDVATGALKLVFSGKVLQDSATLGDSGLKEGDFLVVMAAKPKAGEAAPAPAAAPAPVPAAAPAPAPAPVAPAPAADQAAAAGMAGGAQLEETIKMMCEMGFPRSDCERALRAAFGNADRAVEYLMTGIPQHLQQQASGQAPPAPAPAPAAQQARGMPMMPPAAPATGPLAQLQNHPLFFRIKAAVQQNPASLNQVMTVLYQQNPNLITLIAENQEEFVRILAEPLPAGMALPGGRGSASSMGSASTAGTAPAPPAPAPPAGAPAPGAPAAGGGGDAVQMMMQMMQAGTPAAPPAGGAAPPAAAPAPAPAAPGAAAPLTPEQLQAVERLQALGFERAMVIEALQACNMNEELAASYLFDMAEDN